MNELTVVTPMTLIQMAVQQSDVSIERMEQLLNLQIRWEENEAKKAYHNAVAEFKTESITIIKDKQVGYTNKQNQFVGYSHASLGSIVQTIIPLMSKYGLSHSWDIKQEGGGIMVTCHLRHSMGHSTSVTMAAGKDDSGQKNLIQQVASTVTYLERYTLLAITGLAAQDQDDDGAGSGSPNESGSSQGKPPVTQPQGKAPADSGDKATQGQVKILFVKMKQAGVEEADFLTHFGVDSVADLPRNRVNEAIKALADGAVNPHVADEPPVTAQEEPEKIKCKNCGEMIDPLNNTGHLEGCSYAS